MRNDDVWNDLPPRDDTFADHPRQVARDSFTREDAELFAFDALRPAHQRQTCEVVGCWVCAHENRNTA